MPRNRRNRVTRPQNEGANRNRAMRNNARAQQNRGTFQGGLTKSQGIAPQNAGQPPAQNRPQCPPGQQPGRDEMGNQTCVPERANISSKVPVNNASRAISPGTGIKPKGY